MSRTAKKKNKKKKKNQTKKQLLNRCKTINFNVQAMFCLTVSLPAHAHLNDGFRNPRDKEMQIFIKQIGHPRQESTID